MISQSRVALVLAGEVLPNSKQKLVPILYTAAGGLLTTGSAYKLKAKKKCYPRTGCINPPFTQEQASNEAEEAVASSLLCARMRARIGNVL